MAETLISPGVLALENDNSFVSSQPVNVGAAIIGPTVKGPVEIPTIVTSYSDYQNKFGTTFISGGQVYSYFTSIVAYNYFANGGQTLLVSRVVTGSFTHATSSKMYNEDESGVIDNITSTSSLTINSFNITSSAGNGPTGTQMAVQSSTTGTGTGATITASFANSESISTIIFGGGTGYKIGDTITFSSSSLGSDQGGGTDLIITLAASNIINNNALIIKTISEGSMMNNTGTPDAYGSLASGSIDNIRWQIANHDTASGTFSLLVRRGDDNTINPVVLETWTNLSMDPTAPNYVARVIGNQYKQYNQSDNQIEVIGDFPNNSRYIYVSSVLTPTPLYFDNNGLAKSQYTGSIPVNAEGTFGGATGELFHGVADYFSNIDSSTLAPQGIPSSSYDNMIDLLSNADDYKFNILLTPGLFASTSDLGSSQVTTAINNTQNRGDSIYIVDLVPYSSSINDITSQANSKNTSYAAAYWPWVQVIDPDSAQLVWVPASTVIAGVYAYNDSVSEPWFAPAGINRGGLGGVVRAEKKLTQSNRDTLYNNKVNPIATFPGTGVVVYGQKTLQTKASALDRVNVRRLLIQLKSYISQVAQNLVFEQNTIATRNQFLSQVNPYLESVQQRQGLYAFKVIMDDSNNTADVIDRNQMVGQIYIQPTKTAEFIYLDFNILPTGAVFPS